MNKNELNKTTLESTLGKAIKGINRGVHSHFHAG